MIKLSLTLFALIAFSGCVSSNYATPNSEIPEDEHIAVCGLKNGAEQTYPTLKDLKADGAKFVHYDPCYN